MRKLIICIAAGLVSLSVARSTCGESIPTLLNSAVTQQAGHSWDCALSGGSLWIAHQDAAHYISRFSPSLEFLGSFQAPRDIFSIADGREFLWLADVEPGDVYRFSYAGEQLERVEWAPGWGDQPWEGNPRAINRGLDDRLLYCNRAGVREFSEQGEVVRHFQMRGGEEAGDAANLPGGGVAALTNWGQFGEVAIFGVDEERLRTYSRQGGGQTIVGFNQSDNWLDWMRISTDSFGNIYICQYYFQGNSSPGNIYKIAPEGQLLWWLPVRLPEIGAGIPKGLDVGPDLTVYVLFKQWSEPTFDYISRWRQEEYQARIEGQVLLNGEPPNVPSKIVLRRIGSKWEYPIDLQTGRFGPFPAYPAPAVYMLQAVPLEPGEDGASNEVSIENLRNDDTLRVNLSWNSVYDPPQVPTDLLLTAFPNPFNFLTNVSFAVPKPSSVSLQVFDLAGRPVVTLFEGEALAGTHRAAWDASNAVAGIYVLQMSTANGYQSFVKVALLK